jgi:hypothetical protein
MKREMKRTQGYKGMVESTSLEIHPEVGQLLCELICLSLT